MLYTAEGKTLVERSWEETMAELEFAKPLAMLAEMGSRKT